MPSENDRPVHRHEHAGPTVEVVVCDRCDRTSVLLDPDETDRRCHGEQMNCVGTPDRPVTRQALRSTLAREFGIPASGVDVCYSLYGTGLLTTVTLASRIDRDPVLVRTHLHRLAETGHLTRTELPREDGGTVDVYHPPEREGKLPATLAAFCRLAALAAGEALPAAISSTTDPEPVPTFRATFCPDGSVSHL